MQHSRADSTVAYVARTSGCGSVVVEACLTKQDLHIIECNSLAAYFSLAVGPYSISIVICLVVLISCQSHNTVIIVAYV